MKEQAIRKFYRYLRLGFASLFRRPGFTIVAVATLALGIAMNVAVISFARPLLFPSFPHFERPEELVVVQRWRKSSRPQPRPMVSYPIFTEWKDRNRSCQGFSLLIEDEWILTRAEGDPERLQGLMVSGAAVDTLGVQPALGRGFSPNEDRRGAARTAMISHELWQSRWGGDAAILGRSITLDNQDYTVIGVLPSGLPDAQINGGPLGSIWLPISLFYDDLGLENRLSERDYTLLCRLQGGVEPQVAEQDFMAVSRALASEYSDFDEPKAIGIVPLRTLETGTVRPMILALLAGAFLLLLIACTNLVNLLLSRLLQRQRDLVMRQVLGAGRADLVVMVMAEILALALMASLVGVLLATFAVRALVPLLHDVPYVAAVGTSPAVLAYAAILCLIVALMVGLVPALRATRHRSLSSSDAADHRTTVPHSRLRGLLIVAEVALALLVVAGTGFAWKAMLTMQDFDRGFSPESVLKVDIDLPLTTYPDSDSWTRFFDRIVSATEALPGVAGVALLSDPPLADRSARAPLFAGDQPIPPREEREITRYYTVSPGVFELLDIPLVDGRTFTRDDDLEAPWAVMISRSVADTFWPGESAVGRQLAFEGWGNIHDPSLRWREIVGVVEDVHFLGVEQQAHHHAVFIPYTQRPRYRDGQPLPMALLLEAELEPEKLAEAVRTEVLRLDAGQPIDNVRTLAGMIAEDEQPTRRVAVLFSCIAALALGLALAGIYGVMTFLIAGRAKELGVRVALGATPGRIFAYLVLRHSGAVALGCALGCVATALVARVAVHRLYGVEAFEPVVYGAAMLVMAVVALASTLIPAVRAVGLDPVRSLRDD